MYDYIKWTAQVLLPGLGTLYVALAALWGLPAPEAVAGSILAIDTFLGVILGISQKNYGKQVAGGTMNVYPKSEGGMTYSLVLDGDPVELVDKEEVRFKVEKPAGR